jgi:hypothetical protein
MVGARDKVGVVVCVAIACVEIADGGAALKGKLASLVDFVHP